LALSLPFCVALQLGAIPFLHLYSCEHSRH
jgi:hypothetical protein